MSKYKCPACGFQIFNRRVNKCEACGGHLPEELLFSREETSRLDAQYEISLKESEARRRKERKGSGSDGGGYGGGEGSWGSDSSGDGGGGCD